MMYRIINSVAPGEVSYIDSDRSKEELEDITLFINSVCYDVVDKSEELFPNAMCRVLTKYEVGVPVYGNFDLVKCVEIDLYYLWNFNSNELRFNRVQDLYKEEFENIESVVKKEWAIQEE